LAMLFAITSNCLELELSPDIPAHTALPISAPSHH
jgi:hypothetical protein